VFDANNQTSPFIEFNESPTHLKITAQSDNFDHIGEHLLYLSVSLQGYP